MPDTISFFCAGRINGTHAFIAGNAFDSGNAKKAYIYDLKSNKFTQIPDMRYPRTAPGCGLVNIKSQSMGASQG